jgi:CheY-like chemotaxis protein
MPKARRLDGKRVLIVDDEPDVLQTLAEDLSMCTVREAGSYEAARQLLETESFDIAVLDIMGVDGYALLQIARDRDILPVMLTAHALDPSNLARSYQEGAASYIPKDKMGEIATYLEDILEAREKGKGFWWRWLERFDAYFDKRFGPDWREKDKTFWENFSI